MAEGINNIVYIYYTSDKMTKLISLSNEAYAQLLKLKTRGSSFSDTIMSLIKKSNDEGDIRRFAGSMRGHKTELEDFKRLIEKDRRNNYGRTL